MSVNDIQVLKTQKYKATTDSTHNLNVGANLLNQDFGTTGSNPKWAGDITCIWTREGWLYLAVIIDLYSRRVIGRVVRNTLKTDSAIRALQMALNLRQPEKDAFIIPTVAANIVRTNTRRFCANIVYTSR